jgi:hypothetical protein
MYLGLVKHLRLPYTFAPDTVRNRNVCVFESTRLRAGRPRKVDSILGWNKRCYRLHNMHVASGTHRFSGDSFPVVKRRGVKLAIPNISGRYEECVDLYLHLQICLQGVAQRQQGQLYLCVTITQSQPLK